MALGEAAPELVPVSQVMMCMNCTADFSLTLRRHHCNACGKVRHSAGSRLALFEILKRMITWSYFTFICFSWSILGELSLLPWILPGYGSACLEAFTWMHFASLSRWCVELAPGTDTLWSTSKTEWLKCVITAMLSSGKEVKAFFFISKNPCSIITQRLRKEKRVILSPR